MTRDPQLIKAYLSAQRPASLGWATQPTQPIFIVKQKKNPNRNPTTIQYRDNLSQLLIAPPLLTTNDDNPLEPIATGSISSYTRQYGFRSSRTGDVSLLFLSALYKICSMAMTSRSDNGERTGKIGGTEHSEGFLLAFRAAQILNHRKTCWMQ